jgi:hypothetical protein
MSNLQDCDVKIGITVSHGWSAFIISIIESEREKVIPVNFQYVFYLLCHFIKKKCKHDAELTPWTRNPRI